MVVILFAPRFAPLVESGTKRQTVRARRKRPVKAGDSLSLRAWEGAPYRSPQRLLRLAVCFAVEPIRIDDRGGRLVIELGGVRLHPRGAGWFARADGFADATDMARWWRAERWTPFDGELIRWAVAAA